jgi:VanZ family protein
MKELVISRVVLAVWLAAVCLVVVGSLKPEPELPMPFSSADKLYHWGGYAVLALLPFFAFGKRGAWAAALSMILLGAALELAQGYVPGRTPSALDFVANTAGVFSGILAASILKALISSGVEERGLRGERSRKGQPPPGS